MSNQYYVINKVQRKTLQHQHRLTWQLVPSPEQVFVIFIPQKSFALCDRITPIG